MDIEGGGTGLGEGFRDRFGACAGARIEEARLVGPVDAPDIVEALEESVAVDVEPDRARKLGDFGIADHSGHQDK